MAIGQTTKTWRPRLGAACARMPALAVAGMFAWSGVLLVTGKADAGDTPRRAVFEVEVEIDAGHERWKNGLEWKDGAFSLSYTLNIPYLAAPSLDSINPYAPDYGATALRQAAEAQSRATAIARRSGSGAENPFNTVFDPGKMIQVDPELLADLSTRSQACGRDRVCLMKLGLEMMKQNAAEQHDALLKAMEEIGAECSQTVDISDGQAFDACLQEKGGQYAMTTDGADLPDTGPGFAEPAPDRFQRWEMNWNADGGCGATVVADYRYEAADALNDVTGPVLGNETAIGAAEGDVVPGEMPMVCSSNQIITDVRTGKIYFQSFYMPTIPVHHTIESKLRGGHLESTKAGGLPGGVDIVKQVTVTQWITEKLTGAPVEGHEERAFKVKGDMNGVSLPTGATGTKEIVPDETDPFAWKWQAPNFHETEFVAKLTWHLKEMQP